MTLLGGIDRSHLNLQNRWEGIRWETTRPRLLRKGKLVKIQIK